MLPVIDKDLDTIAEELKNWLDGEDNPMLDEWYDEYGMSFIGDFITKKGRINYAELGRQLAFERQEQSAKYMNFGLYIDNNKRELERIKRISKFEGANQKKCKRIQRDIEKAIEKLENHDKYIFDRFSKSRYRTVEYKGFNEMVKTKIYFYDLDTYEERLDGMYYVNFKSSVNKKEKEEILRFIDKVIMKNKRAAGVKIDIDNTEIKKRSACYYSPSEDKIVIGTMDLLNRGWRGGRVIGHELGHRPHTMLDTHYEQLAISKEDKKTWEQLTEKYYKKYKVDKEPLDWDRFKYPINAEDYYKDKDKRHFYNEMWAEVTSVVTSPDDAYHNKEKEIEKLEKYFPDLKEFMEKIYGI